MKRIALLFFIVFSLQITIAQEFEMIRHQVKLGETVRMISRKYKIEPAEIYRLNKFAVDGITQGQVLQLIVPKTAPETEVAVTDDETKTDTAPEEVESSSTTTKTVTTTTTRKKKVSEPESVPEQPAAEPAGELGDSGSAVTHTVESGETLIGIGKKYGVSVADIKSQNEKILKRGLRPGQVLAIIKPGGTVAPDVQVDEPVTDATTTDDSGHATIKHKVQKGETLFYLAKKYQVSVDDIKMQNEHQLKKGLQIGQVLTITTAN